MFVVNGIAYAGEPKPILSVVGIRPMKDFMLWVRFNNGEAKIFDFKPLLSVPVFAPLADEEVFKGVYIDYGIPVWNDGEIDIAPEKLYADGVSAESKETA